jgi:hypothetical protein
VIVAVAGNKADLLRPDPGFDLAAAEEQCAQLGVPFHLTSAETGEVRAFMHQSERETGAHAKAVLYCIVFSHDVAPAGARCHSGICPKMAPQIALDFSGKLVGIVRVKSPSI